MTYQSSPYFPNLFPDEAYRMNRVGVRSMRVTPTMNLDIETGTKSPWLDETVRMVHAGLKENKRKELGMLGHVNTTVRSQRYALPASRSSTHNGRFPGMEYSSAGFAFRGGAMCGAGNTETAEGRRYIQDVLLKRRIEEYKNLASGVFSETGITGVPPPMNPETVPVDVNITTLQDAILAGVLPSKVLPVVKGLALQFYRIGEQLSSNQIANYIDVLTNMWQQIIEGFSEETQDYNNLTGKEQRYIPLVVTAFERIGAMLEMFAKTADEPMEERMRTKDKIRRNFLDLLNVDVGEAPEGISGETNTTGITDSSGSTGASSWNAYQDW